MHLIVSALYRKHLSKEDFCLTVLTKTLPEWPASVLMVDDMPSCSGETVTWRAEASVARPLFFSIPVSSQVLDWGLR